MGVIASQITSLTIVFSTFYSDAEHQSSASLSFVRGIHRVPVNSPHKWQVTRKMFPFDDVIMNAQKQSSMRCMVSCLSTHWGIVVQISVSKLGHQWLRQTSKPMMTYHHLPLSATACEISICILYFSFKEMYLKMFACNRSGLGILTHPSPVTHKCIAGLGISSATWHCRKNCSRWQHSFNWKLCCNWLKWLRQRQIANTTNSTLNNTLRPRQNGRHLPDWHFQMHFREWKCMNCAWDFTEVCF